MEVILFNPSQNGNSTNNTLTVASNNLEPVSTSKPFLESNTVEGNLWDLRHQHVIPAFARDNEPLISQLEFIETTQEIVHDVFSAERILSPSIRLSHPIKSRVPEARNKPANELQEWEKTIFYERMAFVIEVSSICDSIQGERLSLTIGGIKAYNLDNLGGRKGSEQHFKFFIGFKVSVCTNLCVWTDGFSGDVKVHNLLQLRQAIYQIISNYDAVADLTRMIHLQDLSLTEHQFAQLIGRCRLYQYLPNSLKQNIPELRFGDSQINSVCRDYYKNHSFCRDANGNINLWRVYNLLTAANKQSYVDLFLDRAVNASTFTGELAYALEHRSNNWFLNY
jgi:hypothetical protein